MQEFANNSKEVNKLYYPTDYLPTINSAQTELIDKFVEGLEQVIGKTRTEISLADEWEKDLPDGAEHRDLPKYLELVISDCEAISLLLTFMLGWLLSVLI